MEIKNFFDKIERIGTFLIVIISLVISLRSCSTSEKLAHMSVEPEIKLYFQGKPPEGKIVIYNNGHIKAVSLSASRLTVLIPIGDSPYSGTIGYGGERKYDPNNEIWKFLPSFSPKESVHDSMPYQGSTENGASRIAVHVFDLTYYRDSDMKLFQKRVLFFDDGKEFMNHDHFRKHPNYETVIRSFENHFAGKSISEIFDRIRRMSTNIETE